MAGARARAEVDHLVVDDRELRAGCCPAGAVAGTVVLVADNAGLELLPDLVLIDQLLDTGLAAEVVLQVKPRRTSSRTPPPPMCWPLPG